MTNPDSEIEVNEEILESDADEILTDLDSASDADVEAVLASADDDIVTDEELAASAEFSLQSPEMAAKIQIMHEELPLTGQIEAAIFAAPNPLRPEDILPLISHSISLEELEDAIAAVKREYDQRQGGFSLEYVKGLGYQFQTVPVAAPIMARMFATRPRPLSRAALETLSIIAYRQPCTRAAIEFIRGVDAGSIIKNLLERNLIKCVGRKEDAGRPMLFGTTDEFLQVFGIGNLKDLPPLSSFQPTSDTVREAMKELEQLDAVDVEDFVADEDKPAAEFGEGLLAVDEEAEATFEEDSSQEDVVVGEEDAELAVPVVTDVDVPQLEE